MRFPSIALVVVCTACGGPSPDEQPVVLAYEDARSLEPAHALDDRLLTWRTPVTATSLGSEPDDLVRGATLADIVASRAIARPDGKLCSECHYRDAPDPYRPDVEQHGVLDMGPHDAVDGRAWAGDTGWAQRFCWHDEAASYEKPAYLRAVFERWRALGEP